MGFVTPPQPHSPLAILRVRLRQTGLEHASDTSFFLTPVSLRKPPPKSGTLESFAVVRGEFRDGEGISYHRRILYLTCSLPYGGYLWSE